MHWVKVKGGNARPIRLSLECLKTLQWREVIINLIHFHWNWNSFICCL